MTGNGRHWFVSARGELLPRWREAFPEAVAMGPAGCGADRPCLVWVRLPTDRDPAGFLARLHARPGGVPLVVLSDRPDDEEGLACFAAGASGYCNSHAAPAVLRQVADTVLKNGLWIGPSLMGRLRRALARAGSLSESSGG